jgi:hypothetical protein
MPHRSSIRKWLYFAVLVKQQPRCFSVGDFVDMCHYAGCKISKATIYNAMNANLLRWHDGQGPHAGRRVYYADFVSWFGYDPLEVIRVNEQAEGKTSCPACHATMEMTWSFCPGCARPNKYAVSFEELKSTTLESNGRQLRRTG